MELPKELIDAVKNNNLVIFVGAGLSVKLKNQNNLNVGTWWNLVDVLVEHFKKDNFLTAPIEVLLKKKGVEVTEPLNKIEVLSRLPKDERINYLKYKKESLVNAEKPISMEMAKDFASKHCSLNTDNDFSLHKKISKLFNIIITTNYDNAFELANKNLKTVLIDENIPSEKYTSESILFKLHGSIDKPKTMVVFPRDYAYLYEHMHHSVISYLKTLLIQKSILFIGYGLGDWQISNIFLKTKELLADTSQKHFVIINKEEFEKKKEENKKELGFLQPIFVTNFEKDEVQYNEDIHSIIDILLEEKNNSTTTIDFDYLKEADKLFNLALISNDENQFEECCKYYKKAAQLLHNRSDVLFSNWGTALRHLGKIRKSEALYLESLKKIEIAIQLNESTKNIHNYDLTSNGLWKLEIEKVLRNDKYSSLSMIPVKVCNGSTNKYCGAINLLDDKNCKRCDKPLPEKWGEGAYIVSGAICNKCKKYIGLKGARCISCGNVVPEFYEDFLV